MKSISTLNNLFSAKETLNQNQSLKIKGGDDKRAPLPLPIPTPLPTPNGCAWGFFGLENK